MIYLQLRSIPLAPCQASIFLHHLMVADPPTLLSSSIAHHSPLNITLQLIPSKLTHKCTDCWFMDQVSSYIFNLDESLKLVCQASLFLNGNGAGEGTHVSLYIKVSTFSYDYYRSSRCLSFFFSIIIMSRLYLESMTRSWNGRFATPCLSPS